MLGGTLLLLKMPQQELLLQLFTYFAIFHFFGPQKREFVLDLHFYHRCPQAKQHTTTKSKQLFGQRVKGVYSGTVDLLERFIDTWLVGMVYRVHNFPIYHNYPQNVKYGFCLSEIIYCYIQAYLFSDRKHCLESLSTVFAKIRTSQLK